MSVKLQWSGLNEFLREFGAIPAELRDEGMEIVREETTGAAVELAGRYGRKTGRLGRGVRVDFPSSQILTGQVFSAERHSHLYDFGTRDRHTRRGAFRGRVEGKDVLVPIVRRRRARMTRRLEELLRRKGFQVGGVP